ncbi:MAG: DUF3048 domain-containing protein [Aeromicrobium erythreum]
MKVRLLVPALTLALVAAGCSSSDDKPDPKASRAAAQKIVEVSPLTGRPMPNGRPDNPVFIVKIENTEGGAPQYGLDQADLVVEELVEGGLTRLAAFFYSTLPSKVGHVRSMRATDIGIAAPVDGQIVASGGASGTIRKVKKAGIRVWSEDEGAPGFSSDPLKVRPYNRLIDLKRLDRSAKVTTIPGPYLPWVSPDAKKSAAPSASASASTPAPRKVSRATVRFSPSTQTSWKLSGGAWRRTNGHAAKEYPADTLVVMFCDVGDAGYTDPAGNPVPETKVVGSGRAVVMHGGEAVEATWRKASKKAEIVFTDKAGKPLELDPGRVWIELVPKGQGSLDAK